MLNIFTFLYSKNFVNILYITIEITSILSGVPSRIYNYVSHPFSHSYDRTDTHFHFFTRDTFFGREYIIRE